MLKELEPDAVVLPGEGTLAQQLTMLEAAHDLGLDCYWIQGGWNYTQIFNKFPGEYFAGKLYGSGQDYKYAEPGSLAYRLYEEFISRHGEENWNVWASAMTDVFFVARMGVEAADSDDPTAVRDALQAIDSFIHPTYTEAPSTWFGTEIYGARLHILTPQRIVYPTADGGVEKFISDIAGWWEKPENRQVAIDYLEERGLIYPGE